MFGAIRLSSKISEPCGSVSSSRLVTDTSATVTPLYFGSLLLGTRGEGRLRYAGKVDTGFSASEMVELHRALRGLERTDCPADPAPTRAEARGARWADPSSPIPCRS